MRSGAADPGDEHAGQLLHPADRRRGHCHRHGALRIPGDSTIYTIEEESDRSKGKGRRCWLGDGIAIKCQEDLKKRMNRILVTVHDKMDTLDKWIIILFTPNYRYYSPKMDVLPNTFL